MQSDSSTEVPSPELPHQTVALVVGVKSIDSIAQFLIQHPNLQLHVLTTEAQSHQLVLENFAQPIASGQVAIQAAAPRLVGIIDSPLGWEPSIDDYCRQHRIPRLAVLRLDASGENLQILRGAADMLRQKAVDEIHFNYGPDYREAGVTLGELYAFLVPFGYQIWKVLPDRLQPQGEILPSDETYEPTEFVASLPQPTSPSHPAPTPPSQSHPPLTYRTLGLNGRFGNHIFQYAFLRILAHCHHQPIQAAPWIGHELFGHHHPPVELRLPQCVESHNFPEGVFPRALFEPPARAIDLWGFFQFDTAHYAPHRDFFRSLFRPKPTIEGPLKKAVHRLRQSGRTLVGLHIRRGDFGSGPFFVAPNDWYLDFLHRIWPTLADPVLFIASDEPIKILADFREFHPVTSAQLLLHLPQAPFYPDFYLLSQCDILAIANSSFSFAAAMLNECATAIVRPHLHLKRLIPFDPWSSPPLLHRELGRPLRDSVAEMMQ